jgi:RecB family exonuclease
VAAEVRGTLEIPEAAFTLTATADRIDRLPDSRLILIDYKTGTPPTPAMMERFDKQLLLEALIARAGGFEGVPAAEVDHVAHIGLGSTPVWREHRLVDEPDNKDRMLRFSPESVRSEFLRLLAFYDDPKNGYVSRLAMHKVRFEGDYDHLARFGEWDDTQSAERIDVG